MSINVHSLAKEIFMADNSNADNPLKEWNLAGAKHREYAYGIAEGIKPFIERYAQSITPKEQ